MRHRIEGNKSRCRELVEKTSVMVTALARWIGYDAAAAGAHEAVATCKSVREVARLKTALTSEQLEKSSEPWNMTMPGREKH